MTTSVDRIDIDQIAVPGYHRAIKPNALKDLVDSIKDHSYNIAYPIVIDSEKTLVDGRHRLEAMLQVGSKDIPYIIKPDGLSNIRFGMQCNADSQLSQADDVFDLAELCWNLARDGWTGQEIADELGWSNGQVSQYKGIKEKLHSLAWDIVRFTKNENMVNVDSDIVVNQFFTPVNWTERHFRALLKHLPYTEGDRAAMRMQIKAIRACIARANEKDKRFGQRQKKVTAQWIGNLAEKLAWHMKLAKHMRDTVVERVGFRDRVRLLETVYSNVFGERDDDVNFQKFDTAVRALNEKKLGVTLYHGDAFQGVPLLDDKSVSLVVTDPPYNTTQHEWDRIGTDDEYLEFTQRWLDSIRPKLAEDYHLFFFCDPRYVSRIEALLLDNGWQLRSRIIWWNKSLPSGGNVKSKFVSTWQMVFHCGTHELNWSPEWDSERFDVQEFSAPNSNTRDGGFHPTPKPVDLLSLFVNIGSKPGDMILDQFAGGGATGEAASSVGQRQCILIEREDGFCTQIEKRLGIKRSAI